VGKKMTNNRWPWDFEDNDDDFEIIYTGSDFDIVPKKRKDRIDKNSNLCEHEWKAESYFSAKVYETCKKCGFKKEDL
jgi:hypothetical protein